MTCVLCADYEDGGKLAEQQRIIELIENELYALEVLAPLGVPRAAFNCDFGKQLIALIKGETK